MNRIRVVLAVSALGAILGPEASAQDCPFPWTITVTPAGPQTVAVNICGRYAGCIPRDPQFTIAGSEINVTMTGAELPDCGCLGVVGTFTQSLLVHPITPGDYTVTTTLIDCGSPIAAGTTRFTFSGGLTAVPTLGASGIAALVLLMAIVGVWRLRV